MNRKMGLKRLREGLCLDEIILEQRIEKSVDYIKRYVNIIIRVLRFTVGG